MARPAAHAVLTLLLGLVILGVAYGAFVALGRLETLGAWGHVRTFVGAFGGAFFLAAALLPARSDRGPAQRGHGPT